MVKPAMAPSRAICEPDITAPREGEPLLADLRTGEANLTSPVRSHLLVAPDRRHQKAERGRAGAHQCEAATLRLGQVAGQPQANPGPGLTAPPALEHIRRSADGSL